MNARKWRKKPSEELIKLMEESVDLKLYLIHERGPLSLTFQDEQNKKYEINIGNEISCSCGGGKIEHCAHTLFALNKIYKIPFNNPLILQLQFTNQELDTLMEKKKKKSEGKKAKESKKLHPKKKREKDLSNQMSLLDDPICPICQEDMYSNEGIFFCKPSCGHNFHIGCLKVFIKHKKDTDMVVSCPMCRAKWEEDDYLKPLMEIRPNKCTKNHKGINCANCQRTNIKFERFHCLVCDNYDLCVECFGAEIHRDKNHCFIFKKHNEDKWTGCEYKKYEDWEDDNDIEENKNNINNNDINADINNKFSSISNPDNKESTNQMIIPNDDINTNLNIDEVLKINNEQIKEELPPLNDGNNTNNKNINKEIFESGSMESDYIIDVNTMDRFKSYLLKQAEVFDDDFIYSAMHIPTRKYVPPPDPQVVFEFCANIMILTKMEKEVIIITLLYLERFIFNTGLLLTSRNWRRIIFTTMAIASKIWDDDSFENNHFAQVFKHLSIGEINLLERTFLEMINYKVYVKCSEYFKYFFIIKSIALKYNYNGVEMIPISVERMMKIQEYAYQMQKRVKKKVGLSNSTKF